ncbi:hypothetical protein [Sphingomonas sp.]|uniref:hypothetical protein n=1 Tax=Sphingomonas sp. TaxID=28214 RepID=UPI0031DB61D1
MSIEQHTPGPWAVTLCKKTRPDAPDIPRHILGADGRRVVTFNSAAQIIGGERRANARLIAAAPELLTSLGNLAEFIAFYFTGPDAEKNRDVEGMENMLAEAETAFNVAAAAIAKARGES